LLVYSKMTALPNVSTVCIGDHHISIGSTSNFIPFYSPWMSLLPPLAHQAACFRVVHSRWPHDANSTLVSNPCSLVGLKIPSHDVTHCSLIELPHDRLPRCSSCLVVVLQKKQPLVCSWLVDELSKITILSRIVSDRLGASPIGIPRWKMPLSLELVRESDYDSLPNRWRITQGTQPERKTSCLESRCYD
jgi:hypothetical protein